MKDGEWRYNPNPERDSSVGGWFAFYHLGKDSLIRYLSDRLHPFFLELDGRFKPLLSPAGDEPLMKPGEGSSVSNLNGWKVQKGARSGSKGKDVLSHPLGARRNFG